MKSAKTPKRMCIACRQMREKSQLIRFVLDSGAKPVVDKKNKAPGRGAYVCRSKECISAMIKRKMLNKNFHCDITAEEYQKLSEELNAEYFG